jgi:hypothetical protein
MIAGNQMDQVPQGDMAFRGVNARLRPSLLPPGYVSSARNMRFTRGSIEPRKGLTLFPLSNKAASFSATITPFTTVYGACVFEDPSSVKWMVIAADGNIYVTRPGMTARVLPLPAATTITAAVDFTQCNNVLMMHRGTSLSQLVMDNLDLPWREVPFLPNDEANLAQNPTDGTSPIPNAAWGVALQNRLILPDATQGKDVLACSDYFNYTRYQPTLEAFRVNAGEDESLVAAFPVPTPDDTPSSALAVFKDNSVFIISGIVGDLSGLARQDVTREYSTANRKAIIKTGRDVWFMAAGRGVSSITQTSQNKWQGVDVPVSTDISPIIDRINWSASSVLRAAKVGNLSYWAVPLDGATANNAMLVYDHEQQAWAGYDTGVAVKEFLVFPWMGVDRLWILTTAGYIGLYEVGASDQTGASTFAAIAGEFTTRGYALRSTLGRVRAKEITLQLSTWNPRYSLSAVLDGVNESRAIATAKTRDRTKYDKPHTRAAWVSTNTNNDHATAYRQDYSAPIGTGSTRFYLNTAGVNFSREQESTERYRVPNGARGQTVQFQLTSDQGRVSCHGIAVETVEVDKRKERKL